MFDVYVVKFARRLAQINVQIRINDQIAVYIYMNQLQLPFFLFFQVSSKEAKDSVNEETRTQEAQRGLEAKPERGG